MGISLTSGDDIFDGAIDGDPPGLDQAHTVAGQAGDDSIAGGDLGDLLPGGKDEDTLEGRGGDDALHGGAGDDLIGLDAGEDLLTGGDGADLFLAKSYAFGAGVDTITDFDALDTLYFPDARGAVFVFEEIAGDTHVSVNGTLQVVLLGAAAPDVLGRTVFGQSPAAVSLIEDGVEAPLTMPGTEGDDALRGQKGVENLLVGLGGDDDLRGAGKNDILLGNQGDDTLRGANGHDTLYGSAGEDTLFGGNGRDRLQGDKNDDELWGGNGADVFHFNAKGKDAGVDAIMDYEVGKDEIAILKSTGFTVTAEDSNLDGDAEIYIDSVLVAVVANTDAGDVDLVLLA